MEWLSGNSFFLILLLLCVGMHFFHGHGTHNKDKKNNEHDSHKHD